MTYSAAVAAALLAVAASPVVAQGFTGGEVGIEYAAPFDGSDFGGTTYSGGLEYAITRQFSVAGNLTGYKLDNLDTTSANLTLHGIFHLSDIASFGVFAAADGIEDPVTGENLTNNLYGIEAGTALFDGNIGGYIGEMDGMETYTMLGLDGKYAIPFVTGLSAVGSLDLLTNDDLTQSQISIGAEYQLEVGPEFYVKVGSNRIDDMTGTQNDGFIALGASVAFGATRGTTFGTRSAFETLPRF